MTSGADPFSILNKNPNLNIYQNRQLPVSKVNRYKTGVKPILEGDNSSDSDSDFDMFSDNKTQVSQFTTNSGITFGEIGKEKKSKILKKNQKIGEIKSKVIKKEDSDDENKKSNAVVRKILKHRPIEKKIEINSKVEVVKRRRNRRNIQEEISTDTKIFEEEKTQDSNSNLLYRKNNKISGDNNNVKEEEETPENVKMVEENSSEYTESDSESNPSPSKIKRPIFIKKDERYAQTLELQEELKTQIEENKRKRAIKEENKQLVVEAKSKRIKEEINEEFGSDVDLPNDEDDDEETSYAKWKTRELERLKRDKEAREREFREKERTEQRRLMTAEELAKEDKRIGKYKEEEKSSYQFMQKYYHQGIFFQEEDDPLFKRDYNIGVGTDNFDKSGLIGRLQVRRGEEHKRGRSKYTHLGDEDTTNFDPDWQADEKLREKALKKMGGYKDYGAFSRPSKKAKR